MTTLVFGQSGQVALALRRLLPDATFLGRAECDLSDPMGIPEALTRLRPTQVINAAAYTAVDQAEKEEALATRINGEAPGLMASFCADHDVPFVHISTDYVFDGQGDQPISPDYDPAPLGAYGRSKLDGEKRIAAAGGRNAILRTSAVVSSDGTNFVKTMLRLGQSRDQLSVVADQFTGPTPASDLAKACIEVAEHLSRDQSASGIYHFAGQPAVSWADFARSIFTAADMNVTVVDIPATDYPTPAKRPLNSRLDSSSLTERFGIQPPDWREALPDMIARITI